MELFCVNRVSWQDPRGLWWVLFHLCCWVDRVIYGLSPAEDELLVAPFFAEELLVSKFHRQMERKESPCHGYRVFSLCNLSHLFSYGCESCLANFWGNLCMVCVVCVCLEMSFLLGVLSVGEGCAFFPARYPGSQGDLAGNKYWDSVVGIFQFVCLASNKDWDSVVSLFQLV